MLRLAIPLRGVLLAAMLAFALPACEDLGPDRSRLLVRFEERPPLGRERLVVTVADGRRDYYFEGLDLERAADGWWQARELRLSNVGEAVILVALRGAGAAPAAAGELALPLAPNARWRLDVFASSADGQTACGGCTGFRRYGIAPAFRPSAQDWLYVTWTMVPP